MTSIKSVCWNKSKKNIQNLRKMSKNKTQILPKKSKKISPDLAYIMGVIIGDGNIYRGCITLCVKDLDFYNKFKEILERWSKMKCCDYVVKGSSFNPKGIFYRVNLYSVEVASFLNGFNINKIRKSDKKIRQNFLKGIYDSEGWMVAYKLYDLRKAVRQVGISMSDKQTIVFIQTILSSLEIKSNFYERDRINKSKEYVLIIGGKENILNFQKQVGFSIERKRDKINLALNSYVRK